MSIKKNQTDPFKTAISLKALETLKSQKDLSEKNLESLTRKLKSPFAREVKDALLKIKELKKLKESPGNKISVTPQIHALLHEVLARSYKSYEDHNAATLLAKGKKTNRLFNRSQDLFVEALMQAYKETNPDKYQFFIDNIESIAHLNSEINSRLIVKTSKRKNRISIFEQAIAVEKRKADKEAYKTTLKFEKQKKTENPNT